MFWRLRSRDLFRGWTCVLRELRRGLLLRFHGGNCLCDVHSLWRGYLFNHGRCDCADGLPRMRSWVVLGSCRCIGFVRLHDLPLGLLRSNDGRDELHELPRWPICGGQCRGLCELRSGHVPDELHFGELHGLRCGILQPRYGAVGVLRVCGRIVLREHGASGDKFVRCRKVFN